MEKHQSVLYMSYKDKHYLETNACALANMRQPSSSALFIQLRFAKIHETLERKWQGKNVIYFKQCQLFLWHRCSSG